MRPGNIDIILRIPVKTHEISNQRRFGLPCPLDVNYSMLTYNVSFNLLSNANSVYGGQMRNYSNISFETLKLFSQNEKEMKTLTGRFFFFLKTSFRTVIKHHLRLNSFQTSQKSNFVIHSMYLYSISKLQHWPLYVKRIRFVTVRCFFMVLEFRHELYYSFPVLQREDPQFFLGLCPSV